MMERFMSHDQIGKTTRRDFLGTATAATALTLGASPGAEAQNAPIESDEFQVAQLTTGRGAQPTVTSTPDWTKPTAMAIPKEGYFKLEQGRYGPIFPRTPANYGFTIIAKVKPGKEDMARRSNRPLMILPPCWRRCGCTIFVGSCSMSAPACTSCIKAFLIPTLTNILRMP